MTFCTLCKQAGNAPSYEQVIESLNEKTKALEALEALETKKMQTKKMQTIFLEAVVGAHLLEGLVPSWTGLA